MLARRLFKIFRLVLLISIGIAIGVIGGGAYYLNQSGLNAKWRGRISEELKGLGIIADFESLRLDLSKGLIAKGVQVYSHEDRAHLMAELEHLVIDVDKTKLMRGIVRVNNVSLKEADISIPLDFDNPESDHLVINELSGEIYIPDRRTVNAKNILGTLAGIKLDIDANVWNSKQAEKKSELTEEEKLARIKRINDIISEINRWKWAEESPPLLKVYMEGDVSQPETVMVNFSFDAKRLEKNEAVFNSVSLKGDYKNSLITFDDISLKDDAGKLTAHADYHPALKQGNYKATSSLNLQSLAKKLFDADIMENLTFSKPPSIEGQGKVHFNEENKPLFQLVGKATVGNFSFKNTDFTALQTEFSAKGSDLFLTGLLATHEHGEIQGRILIKKDTIRYEAKSTLPAFAYSPFTKNSKLEKSLSNASFSKNSSLSISTEGTINPDDLSDWTSTGHAEFKNIIYKDSPINSLRGDYTLGKDNATFTNIKAEFDYSDYQLRETYGGPASGSVSVDSISIDKNKDTVKINKLKGTVWPSPIVRLFATKSANHIERYRFHRPPELTASGTFGTTKANFGATNFKIDVTARDTTHYKFLGKDLSIKNLKSQVQIFGNKVEVNDLSFDTFSGPCKGNISINTTNRAKPSYSGDIQWQRISLRELGQVYGFDNAEKGLVTGRIDFRGEANSIRSFNAKGGIGLENGNLFSVPMLGPLTPLVGFVLGDRNPSEETAENASCSFIIKNGVLYSNDFLASTKSLKFAGAGNIDLAEQQINMLVRMNARGVFGFIFIPLKPFMGMFQFQGTGSFNDPLWKTVMFTNPPKGKDDPIFREPRRATVIEE